MIKLEHPNIIKIYDYYLDKDNYYIIMEYISGGELLEYINKEKIFSEKPKIKININHSTLKEKENAALELKLKKKMIIMIIMKMMRSWKKIIKVIY